MGKAVLVVEDNEDNLIIVATILRHHGYEILTAPDGEAALDVARIGQPDLVLLDISLPKIDGWEVARVLKSDVDTSSIPIIAFTAHVFQSDRMRAAQQGFVGFLTKPVEPTRILEEVRRTIGPPESH
ncbi:MAG TPA: response regulator [Longimicrobiales bacterium]|nr:response regulator [Longimicrobiales bacterium]